MPRSTPPVIVQVTISYNRSYDAPITGCRGDRVRLDRVDPDAPGWTWCEHAQTGRDGWTPDALLEADGCGFALLRRDYSAAELTATVGETLHAIETLAGWTWCERSAGDAGWISNSKIKQIDERPSHLLTLDIGASWP